MGSPGSTGTLPLVDATLASTTRYLQALTGLDGPSTQAPSLLPGWTRAHVVAHLSRNADAFTRVLGRAATGDPASMYRSQAARDQDIEETISTLDHAGLVRDAHASAGRLADAFRSYEADPGAPYTRLPGDAAVHPVGSLVFRRWVEVEVHHSDLGVDHAPAEWPVDLSMGLVEQRREELATSPQAPPPMVLCACDAAARWTFGEGRGPEVHGTAGDLAWWLVGRGGGQGLSCTSGDLPTLGRWR